MSKAKKVLAVLLSVLTIFGVFSCATPVFAEEYNTYVETKAYKEKILTETVENTDEKAEIVCEVPEKRDEHSKTYKRSDGSFTTVFSQTPLHSYEDGEWKEINNSLVQNGNVIENTDGKFNIEFPESLSSNEKITIENQGENLSFSINNIENSTAVVAPKEETADVVNNDLGKPVSEITYENIDENTDVQYIISSSSVKENIIVSDKNSLRDSYSFDIEKGNLVATLGDDNSLVFKNSQNETVFTIPAPVMTDAANAVSYDIEVSVANEATSTLTLTYTPSKEWLESNERVYPVTIDPVIEMPSGYDEVIEDTMISSDNPTSNYSDYYTAKVQNTTTADGNKKHSEVLVKLDMDAFSLFSNPEIVVTDANYCVRGYVSKGTIVAKEILGAWESEEITYENVYPSNGDGTSQISYADETIDYFVGLESEISEMNIMSVCFNITELFNKWLGGATNNGFALVAGDSQVSSMLSISGYTNTAVQDTHYSSSCIIDYVDTSCGIDSFEYLTQEIGRAGTAYVNTFSHSLTMTRSDLSMDGLRMPVSIGFAYNPALNHYFDYYMTSNGINIFFPYGNNWLPLNLQGITQVTEIQWQAFTGEGTLVTFNQSTETIEETDADGNTTTTEEIVFEADSTSDSGYSLELIDETKSASATNLKLVAPDGTAAYFNSMGLVIGICNGDDVLTETTEAIRYTYDSQNPVKLTKITDGVGRQYVFSYNATTGLLEKVNCLTADGTQIKAGTTETDLCVTYAYDTNGNLTAVTYPDGKTATYTYSGANLTKAQNIDNYNIQYTYDNLGKVIGIAEYANTTPGNTIELTQLSNRQVKVDDAYLGIAIYQFGRDGKLHYTFDDKGNFCKSDYAVSSDENVYSGSEWKIASENLLKNGSFEEASALNNARAKNWSANFEKTEVEDCFDGNCAYLISSDADVTKYVEQTIDVLNSSSYTLSAYVKSQVAGELTFKIVATDENNETEEELFVITSAEGWERFSVTYTPKDIVPVKITAYIGFENNKGTYYVDAIQLESGNGTAEYNLVENGSFNNSDEYWTDATIVGENINGESVQAVKLLGGLPSYNENVLTDNISSITQTVTVDGKKGDVYSIGGWFKGLFDDNCISESAEIEATQLTNSLAQIKVTYSYTDTVTTTDETTGEETQTEQTVTENFAVDLAPHNDGWQYAVDSFALKADVTTIDVTVLAKNIVSDSFATGIELTRDNDAISFDFDEADTGEETSTETEETTETTATCPCADCEEFDCSCRCTSEEECTCVECKRRGNIEEKSEDGKTVTTKSFDGEKYMQSTVHYSDDLNFITSEIDTNNISSGYAYTDSGLQISSSNGSGVATTYQINPMGYLTLAQTNATGLTDNAVKAAISYVYDGDMLTTINEGNVQYIYSYDDWGQLKNISVDGNIIVSYNYGKDEKRSRLNSIVFGDTVGEDFTVAYSYKDGNITSVKKYILVEGEEDAVIYNYEYDNLGNLLSVRDNATGHRISYTETGLVISDINTNQVIYEIADVTPEVEETEETEETETPNTNDPVSITQETANGVSYNHNVYESAYDNATGKTTETEAVVGGKTIGTQTVSDWFGRNESAVVMTKNPVDSENTNFASITSDYEYKTVGNTTTNLVYAINNTIAGNEANSVNYAYTYDTNGRITGISTVSSVQNMSGITSYVYDELGQLVSETNGTTTYEYAYDSKGNISSRKTYSGETLVSTDTFTYGTEAWEDRLTGYNNQAVTYDSIGNPTSYLGATLIWRGRELSKYVEGNKQISYSYDVDGMRYQKIVKTSGVETSRYDYVYSDGKLILLTHTANGLANTARFIYDSFGEPRGFILNNSASYLYLKNGQGDITAIVDENGEILVRYTYNAWGAVEFIVPFGIDPAVTTVLATVSPFTYRGYCYDFDMGMYYLQSRYYDPEICRFINADSTDYLGATGTLLSYNLFAYCENDGVNFVDVTGTKASEHFKSDWAGIEILKNYLTGGGAPRIYNDQKWATYMKNSYLLKIHLRYHLLSKFINMKGNSSGKISYKTKMVIETGEGIIGYHYLHGTNSTVGGFKIWGVVRRDSKGNLIFDMQYTWNDKIDPNLKYLTDKIKAIFGKVISLNKAKSYIIRITWRDYSVLSPKANGGFYWSKGWFSK